MKNKLKHIKKEYLLLIGLLFFVYWQFWIFGIKVANDFPLIQISSLAEQFDLPRLWHERASEGLGEFGTFVLWSYPMTLLSGLLAKIGFDMSAQVGIVYAIPFVVLGIVGIRRLLKKYNISENAVFVSSFFYLTTTYVLLLIDGGQLTIALNYALLPLAYAVISDSIHKKTRSKLVAVLIISLITALDVRMLFIIAILIVFNFIRDLILEKKEGKLWIIRDYFFSGLVIFIGWLLLNIYWIIPLLKYPISSQLYSLLTKSTGIQPTTWKHALLLLQPHWYLNVFGKVAPIRWEFLLIPAMVFLVPGVLFMQWGKNLWECIRYHVSSIRYGAGGKSNPEHLRSEKILDPTLIELRRSSREVWFWVAVAVVGIFLTKGANPPFGEVYNFLFTSVPGFSLFRDSTKFFFLIALSYSVLIGYSIDFLTKIVSEQKSLNIKHGIANPPSSLDKLGITARQGSKHFRGENKILDFALRQAQGRLLRQAQDFARMTLQQAQDFARMMRTSCVVPIILTSYFIILASPVWAGRMTGMFSRPVYEKESFDVHKIFEYDKTFSRIFYIPSIAPISYISPIHPAVEALRLVGQRPFAIGTVGSYELFNFLREAPYMGEIFKITGIKYIYYPFPDERRETLKQDNVDYYHNFLDQLTNLPWIEKRISESPVAVLQTKETKDRFFVADNTFYVVGSDRIYNDLIKIPEFDLSKNALIFAEEKTGIMDSLDPYSKVIVYGKSKMDFIMSILDKNNYFFPAVNYKTDPDGKEKIWKRETNDFLWLRNFLQTKYGVDYQEFDYGKGVAIAEDNQILKIQDDSFVKGDRLFIRIFNCSKGGKVEVYQKVNGKEVPINGGIATNGICLSYKPIKLSGYKEIPDQYFNYDCGYYFWAYVGNLIENKEVIIKTYGNINIVNAVVSVNEKDFNEAGEIADDLYEQNRVFEWNKMSLDEKTDLFKSNSKSEIVYKRISPTKYEIEITNLQEPAYLIFSETFDELWELNGQPAKQVYSLLNGFYVDKPGKYTVYFTPQKYVLPGLLISDTTLIFILGTLFATRRKR